MTKKRDKMLLILIPSYWFQILRLVPKHQVVLSPFMRIMKEEPSL